MTHHPKPIRHFVENGIKLIPRYPNGGTLGSWKDADNFTSDINKLKEHWNKGLRNYQLHPYVNGYIVFDIDIKNGKDGLQDLHELMDKKNLLMPSYIIDVNTHPAHTKTPSGGYHLYFKYSGDKMYRSTAIKDGFEVIHYNHLATCPGSLKDEKPYLFYGDLKDAPELPRVLKSFLTEWSDEPIQKTQWTFNRKEYGDISLDKICEIIDSQGEYSIGISRNQYCFAVAKFAQKKEYTETDVESYLCDNYKEQDFTEKEIKATVKSAYK